MERDTLFISHATPKDNEFSIWIASRLEMLGYKVWIDKQQLLGGEIFWQNIQEIIRDHAAKILLVYSDNVKDSKGNLKDGINREINYALGIGKDKDIHEFIIPLHIDNSSFNNFIDIASLNQIEFSSNWFYGFTQLIQKLQKDSVPVNESEQLSSTFSNWYEDQYISNCKIKTNRSELLYTSWWKITNLPEYFYIYKFKTEAESINVKINNNQFPISIISNVLITFEENLIMPKILQEEKQLIIDNEKITPLNREKIKINEIGNIYDKESFPHKKEIRHYFSSLVSVVYNELFISHNLLKYQFSGKTKAYYLPIKNKKEDKIKFIYPYSERKKIKTKSIHGKFKDIGYWHYAVSYKVLIDTIIGVSLQSHILFTSDGIKPIDNPTKQHSYRREKGSHFFNEQWRDMQLAFIQRLTDSQNKIEIIVTNDNKKVEINPWPEMFWAQTDYDDPNSEMRIDEIEDYNEDIEGDIANV